MFIFHWFWNYSTHVVGHCMSQGNPWYKFSTSVDIVNQALHQIVETISHTITKRWVEVCVFIIKFKAYFK